MGMTQAHNDAKARHHTMRRLLRQWRTVSTAILKARKPHNVMEDQRLYNLGLCYATGEGVHKDIAKAVALWEEGTLRGYGPAKFNLGMLYFKGEGVQRNIARAMDLLDDAGVFG